MSDKSVAYRAYIWVWGSVATCLASEQDGIYCALSRGETVEVCLPFRWLIPNWESPYLQGRCNQGIVVLVPTYTNVNVYIVEFFPMLRKQF